MYRESQSAHHPIPKKRTMRKYFEIDGCTVTMRHVKELLGKERYDVVMKKAKEHFLADPCDDFKVGTPEGVLTILFQLS